MVLIEEAERLNADCVIVLGGCVRNGYLSNMVYARVLCGTALCNNGAARKVLMNGDYGRVDYAKSTL